MADPQNDQKSIISSKVTVSLTDRTYDIHIGRDVLVKAADLIASVLPKANHAVLISDEHVASIGQSVSSGLATQGFRVTHLEVPSGEASKSVSQAERLWNAMLADRTDRGSVVIAIGGGVVGDLAGFMAASFARGIALVQIPTTLLSQVDSSVGGKTGINLPGAKNIVGAFWQPSCVIIDTLSLDTLPRREFVSGLAEVAKYGVILLPELFSYLEENATAVLDKQPQAIVHVVSESCQAKAAVVEADERETSGRRAMLNYGHTFAHAIENATGYGQYLHGEAVSIGMHMAALLAEDLGRVDAAFVQRQAELLKKLELPIHFKGHDPAELWRIMQHDKKVEHGKLRFVLPTKLGHVELVGEVDQVRACRAIQRARKTT